MSTHALLSRRLRLTRVLPLVCASIVSSMRLATTLPAQQARTANPRSTRSLTGVVRDNTQLPVAGARLSLVGTPLVAFTNESGAYRFTDPLPGVYTVRVVRIGFAPVLIDSVVVAADGLTVRDIQLAAK
ncbi:MAG: carboxypeptidase regulatory-like domain-containing protein, partial [Gemmatimonadaceae bacterium]|nr:carboxypeptidase regulatory-like domain-containing protein [Gemmatimonadaceae bacterium]